MTTPSEVCSLCGRRRGQHRSHDNGCPLHPEGSKLSAYAFSDSHHFTPKPMNLEHCVKCDEPTGRAGKNDDSLYLPSGAGPFCQSCLDAATHPAPHPFNLARALAGEPLRTRDGQPATNLRNRGRYLLATINGDEWPFNLDGTVACSKGMQTNDLFMASEASEGKCLRCDGRGSVPAFTGGLIDCPKCYPPSPKSEAQGQGQAATGEPCGRCGGSGEIVESVSGHGTSKDKPEIRFASCPDCAPETETQRQARIMLESEKEGVVIEWTEHERDEWREKPKCFRFDWDHFDYRIRPQPVPEKARRVWVNRHGNDDALTAFWSAAAAKEDKRYTNRKETIELIELTPAFRAELNAVLEALCQFANATASGLVLREVEHEAQTLLTKLPAIRAVLEEKGMM